MEIEVNREKYRGFVRGFSISSSPLDLKKGYLEITVKRASSGIISDFLHDYAQPGDSLCLWGPFGQFYFKAGLANRLVLIGAGSGITPLMSIIRFIRDSPLDVQAQLLYSARSPEEIIFRKELEETSRKSKLIKCSITVTQASSWNGHKGRIDLDFLKTNIGDVSSLFYVSVPHGMLSSIIHALMVLGVQLERIRSERW